LPYLRQALAARPAPEYESAVRLRLAEALLERQELDEAEKLFREEWSRRPGNPRAGFGLGLIARAQGNDSAAEEFLSAARDSPTARKPAVAELAALARARGEEKKAADLEREAAALPNEPPAWPDPHVDQILRLQVGSVKRARQVAQLEAQGSFKEAADVYREQLRDRPTAQACIGAGMNLARTGDFDRALTLLYQGVRLDPKDCSTHFALAQVLYMRAETELKRSADSPKAKEWFRQAADAARQAAEMKADHAGAYLLWGKALMHRGEAVAAVEPLKKGVACRPEVFNLQLALGEALLEAGRPQEAATHLENARNLNAKDPRPAWALERLRQKK
jgi:tetratricopeptide (TPR) repeat protein